MELFSRYKKILLIVGFITIVLVMGYFLYVLFFKSETPEPTDLGPDDIGTPTGCPIPGTGPGGEIIEPGDRIGLPGEGRVIEKNPMTLLEEI